MGKKDLTNSGLHERNIHKTGYDFSELCKLNPSLKEFVFVNNYGTETIDFANPDAVKKLNAALLITYYSIKFWDFPDENLCPPIPGRVDYIHYLADLLNESAIKENVSIIDVGTGASCIYPVLGNNEYNWEFIATDIDSKSLHSAQIILEKNNLTNKIRLKHQLDSSQIFKGILKSSDKFSASMCNPPFYRSQEEAMQSNERKLKGLGGQKDRKARNFSGKQQELWYRGGEKAFVHTYLYESSQFKTQCFWYSTLVSKKENLESMYSSLKKLKATEIKTIPMHQGNKVTRVVAWTFLNKEEQEEWVLSANK